MLVRRYGTLRISAVAAAVKLRPQLVPRLSQPPKAQPSRCDRAGQIFREVFLQYDRNNPHGLKLTPPFPRRYLYDFSKRSLDIVGSLVGLAVLSPLMLTTYFLILARMGRPVFYTQQRVGYRGASFFILKFRTMTVEDPIPGKRWGKKPKVTPLGRILRRHSIDETPQLVNVLLGQMSLVGPRPRLATEVVALQGGQGDRLNVRAGLSGLAEIRGRNKISNAERIRHDYEYLERRGILLDLWIILVTCVHVILGKDAH